MDAAARGSGLSGLRPAQAGLRDIGAQPPTAKYGGPVEGGVYLDVDCPRCGVITTHDVPARQAGRTDYPVECPACQARFELWLDPQWFMVP